MVLLTLSKKVNQWLGPFLLRKSINARYALGGGVIADNPLMDSLLFLPIAQKLISLEVHEDAKKLIEQEIKKRVEEGSSKRSDKQSTGTEVNYEPFDEASIRLSVLENYLRPALVPTEQWWNVRKWQFHKQIVKWARTEYLLAKYGSSVREVLYANPSLQKSPQISSSSLARRSRGVAAKFLMQGEIPFDEKIDVEDKNESTSRLKKLPTSAQVVSAFGMKNWHMEKNLRGTFSDMAKIAREKLQGSVMEFRGGTICVAAIPDDSTDLTKLSLEDILEVAGGHVAQEGPFNALCEEVEIYQFWTREYVEELGRYLQQKTESYTEGETVILDVGAGDGVLAQFLREYFEFNRHSSKLREPRGRKFSKGRKERPKQQSNPKSVNYDRKVPTVIASDNGSWRIAEKADVEGLSVSETLDRYSNNNFDEHRKQVIVICSWMPMGEDWTALFREANVDEYILIGECDDGQCGDNWETWGNTQYLSDELESEPPTDDSSSSSESVGSTSSHTSEAERSTLPPYEVDGYERMELKQLTPFQFSRFDCRASKAGKTISFQRQQ